MWEAPWNGGRGHHGEVFSAVVAGGGFKGGQVVGASDAKGEAGQGAAGLSLRPALAACMNCSALIPNAKLPHPQGLDVRVTPSAADGLASGGLLKEIM